MEQASNGRGGAGLGFTGAVDESQLGAAGRFKEAPNQVRKNIHLLCDMLGGATADPPANLRSRKRPDEGGPADMAQLQQRSRHMGPC